MDNRKRFLGIAAILAVSVFLCSCGTKRETTEEFSQAEHEFNISILKVGQADAIILKTKNHTALIDCGEEDDGAEVVKHLTETATDTIDYLFITHYDKDHVGGASEVLNSFEADKIIVPDYAGTSDEYETFISALQEKSITPTALTGMMSFMLDDVLFEVYPPQKQSYKEPDNDYSLVLSVTHGENKFLFAGDAEKDRLAELPSQLDLDHDFLKMPHHGNYNKGTVAFLKAVTPAYTVICDSDKNPAEKDTVKALETIKSEVYYTKNGDISIYSDGKNIQILQPQQ